MGGATADAAAAAAAMAEILKTDDGTKHIPQHHAGIVRALTPMVCGALADRGHQANGPDDIRAGMIRLTGARVFNPGDGQRVAADEDFWVRPGAIDVVAPMTDSTVPGARVLCSVISTGPDENLERVVTKLPDEILDLMERATPAQGK